MTPRLSVLIPARNERFLAPTIADLLSKARGDLEVIAVLDGYWPNPPLAEDPRLKILHRGSALGMRAAINAAAQIATGTHFLKADAHTLWDEGFDVKLLADYREANWVLVPRREALDAEAWTVDRSNPKYPVDYHYLAWPSVPEEGLHGVEWRERREARRDHLLDEEMTTQGSAWCMSRAQWQRTGPLDVARYGNVAHEAQEVGLTAWHLGGALMVTKATWYAHLHKGHRYGRGYSFGTTVVEAAGRHCFEHWMRGAGAMTVRRLVERFDPPGWPMDLDAAFAERAVCLR